MSTGDATRFPVDFDALAKGDEIKADVIAEWAGVRPESAAYSGKQAEFQGIIEIELAERGSEVTTRCVGTSIRILTDAEAVEHTQARFAGYLRRAARMHRKASAIDTRNLSADERKQLDRNIVVQGAMLAGASAARREVARIEHQRRVPGLPPAEPAVN